MGPIPTTIEQLKARVFKAWDMLTTEEIRNQFHMESRMEMCIANNGGPTKY
jgi:hypothetical protein